MKNLSQTTINYEKIGLKKTNTHTQSVGSIHATYQ